jgi:hypothetical protein
MGGLGCSILAKTYYGRLSVASTDVEKFVASDLPPTYFLYGTRDWKLASLSFTRLLGPDQHR